jgi:hypothetical protein
MSQRTLLGTRKMTAMDRVTFSALLVVQVACGEARPPEVEVSKAPTASTPATGTNDRREPGPPQGGVDELRALEGKPLDDVRTELGPPHSEREFAMRDCCHEFEIELYNTYPPDEPAHAEVKIRECTWKYDGYSVTAWSHFVGDLWIVLDTSRYADGVEF